MLNFAEVLPQGVPALFRWLSKKYPKIVLPVVEEEDTEIPVRDGNEVIPVDISKPNPNGVEFDNLYLDMNGIVHPCTHPEGKPAPSTEEEMMIEIFKYTERIVNMIRPRKLLMIAIDGVAPRAKMNQQRSRRFRAAQEAKEKEDARKESLVIWESMGQNVTEEMRNEKAWDSNAITPGTPFMDLLAQSLRYWIVQKMNTDPGWKDLEVIISDASVPGEGEHKIMDFIRRQRSNSGHDPNSSHVIYGLDADLIMLSLATHEPHFRVLREDVFFQDTSPKCYVCNQAGHRAAECTGKAKVKADEHDTKNPALVAKKPFIFLDVSILREYLEIELHVPTPFPFDLERAIDDWVLLIFFVGNDFLPHLPSLEIREGAIDKLLRIWKTELPRMGGYLTNHGELEFARAEIILEGLARLEDEIFSRRHEAEQRQDQNAKRRKIEAEQRKAMESAKPSASLQLAAAPATPTFHGLPPRPNFDSFEDSANQLGLGSPSSGTPDVKAAAMAAISGTASDWVNNRREIRMANLSAAEMLKAEMMSAIPANPAARKKHMAQMKAASMQVDVIRKKEASTPVESPPAQSDTLVATEREATDEPPTQLKVASVQIDVDEKMDSPAPLDFPPPQPESLIERGNDATIDESPAESQPPEANQLEEPMASSEGDAVDGQSSPRGVKRKADELDDAEGEDDEVIDLGPDDEEEEEESLDAASKPTLERVVQPDGTVQQEDVVKLFEPGYKERYYRHKFGVEYSDTQFRRSITRAYVEGIAWVLKYYYQGTPSWTWYYPYHFAPFAQDFEEVSKMQVVFDKGQPFKPFEQLMGVFPPASRKHIPEVFQSLMTDEESPIIDFYPESFEIDMNGKKLAWQGVALLPFINEKRLLEAMKIRYPGLSEDEVRRNGWGANVIYVAEDHPLYPLLESLYAKRKSDKPVPIDPKVGRGLNGSLLPDPNCVPGSTFESPLTSVGLPDISGDRSLAAIYLFPKQLTPHRSVLLPGVNHPKRVLTQEDSYSVLQNNRRGQPREAGFNAINSGREGGHGLPRSSYGNGPSHYGGYGGAGRGNYSGGYGVYGNGSGQYERAGPPSRGRGDYGRPNYGGAPPRSSYQVTPMGEYNRPSNYQGGSSNGYSRPPPPPPSSYGSSQYGRIIIATLGMEEALAVGVTVVMEVIPEEALPMDLEAREVAHLVVTVKIGVVRLADTVVTAVEEEGAVEAITMAISQVMVATDVAELLHLLLLLSLLTADEAAAMADTKNIHICLLHRR
ncbi:RAT1 [Sanghuangporus sanghuang]